MQPFLQRRAGFKIEADKAKAVLREARVVASFDPGVRIEGTNSYHWVFHGKDAVAPQPDYSRAARVVHEMMDGHTPNVWFSDRYSAQQKHGAAHQTCLAHLARDTAFALEHGSDDLPLRFKLWFGKAFDLARDIASFKASTIASKKRALEQQLADILAAAKVAPYEARAGPLGVNRRRTARLALGSLIHAQSDPELRTEGSVATAMRRRPGGFTGSSKENVSSCFRGCRALPDRLELLARHWNAVSRPGDEKSTLRRPMPPMGGMERSKTVKSCETTFPNDGQERLRVVHTLDTRGAKCPATPRPKPGLSGRQPAGGLGRHQEEGIDRRMQKCGKRLSTARLPNRCQRA